MTIERAYGHELPHAARQLISLATLLFTLSFPMEENAPKIGGQKDILVEIDRLVGQAERLRAKLYPSHYWAEEYQTDYVSPLDRRLGEQLELLDGEKDVDASIFRISLTGLIESGLKVIKEAKARKHKDAPEGAAWNEWIVWLTLIVKAFQLPDGIRREVYRVRKGKEEAPEPSEFVQLVNALQRIVCPDYHRSSTNGGLAKAIGRAWASSSMQKFLLTAGPEDLKRELLLLFGMQAYPSQWRDDISPIEQALKIVLEGKQSGIIPFIPEPFR